MQEYLRVIQTVETESFECSKSCVNLTIELAAEPAIVRTTFITGKIASVLKINGLNSYLSTIDLTSADCRGIKEIEVSEFINLKLPSNCNNIAFTITKSNNSILITIGNQLVVRTCFVEDNIVLKHQNDLNCSVTFAGTNKKYLPHTEIGDICEFTSLDTKRFESLKCGAISANLYINTVSEFSNRLRNLSLVCITKMLPEVFSLTAFTKGWSKYISSAGPSVLKVVMDNTVIPPEVRQLTYLTSNVGFHRINIPNTVNSLTVEPQKTNTTFTLNGQTYVNMTQDKYGLMSVKFVGNQPKVLSLNGNICVIGNDICFGTNVTDLQLTGKAAKANVIYGPSNGPVKHIVKGSRYRDNYTGLWLVATELGAGVSVIKNLGPWNKIEWDGECAISILATDLPYITLNPFVANRRDELINAFEQFKAFAESTQIEKWNSDWRLCTKLITFR